jgi:hypothetical protein
LLTAAESKPCGLEALVQSKGHVAEWGLPCSTGTSITELHIQGEEL